MSLARIIVVLRIPITRVFWDKQLKKFVKFTVIDDAHGIMMLPLTFTTSPSNAVAFGWFSYVVIHDPWNGWKGAVEWALIDLLYEYLRLNANRYGGET